jgi:hypothetical protein
MPGATLDTERIAMSKPSIPCRYRAPFLVPLALAYAIGGGVACTKNMPPSVDSQPRVSDSGPDSRNVENPLGKSALGGSPSSHSETEADVVLRVLERDVNIRVFVPDTGSAKGLVLIQHGFLRMNKHLFSLARGFEAAGFLVVVPTLGTGQMHNEKFAAAFMEAMGSSEFLPFEFPIPKSVLFVGHSLGSKFVTQAAEAAVQTGGWDIKGTLLLDPVESQGDIERSLKMIHHLPTFMFAAKPHACNQKGNARAFVSRIGTNFRAYEVVGGSHCDAEGQTTDILCRIICGKVSEAGKAVVSETIPSLGDALFQGGVQAALSMPAMSRLEQEGHLKPLQ